MTEESSQQNPQEFDELVFRKEGDSVLIWGVVDGEKVFHAEPEVGRSSTTMRAALQTWIGRAYDGELDDADTEGAFQ